LPISAKLIQVRLGTFDIEESGDAEVELFDWIVESAQATIAEQAKARKLEKETSTEHNAIEKLQKQLDTLIKAKEEHEMEIIHKVTTNAALTDNSSISF